MNSNGFICYSSFRRTIDSIKWIRECLSRCFFSIENLYRNSQRNANRVGWKKQENLMIIQLQWICLNEFISWRQIDNNNWSQSLTEEKSIDTNLCLFLFFEEPSWIFFIFVYFFPLIDDSTWIKRVWNNPTSVLYNEKLQFLRDHLWIQWTAPHSVVGPLTMKLASARRSYRFLHWLFYKDHHKMGIHLHHGNKKLNH